MQQKNFLILDFLIYLLIPIMIYTSVDNAFISAKGLYFIYFLIFIIEIFNIKNININKTKITIFLGIFLGMIVVPLCMFHINDLQGMLYSILIIMFLIVCFVVGKRLSMNFKKITGLWFFLGTIVTDITIIKNIKDINMLNLTSSIFHTTTTVRHRSYLGFSHPNSAAMAICTILLLCYIFLKNNRKYKFIIYMLMIFNMAALLCTNSRTAIFSVILFSIMEISFKFLKKIKNNKLKLLVYFALFIFVILLASKIDLNAISMQSSGRFDSISSSWKKLASNGKIFFGYKVSSITGTNEIFKPLGINDTDNWYFMQILRYGIVGLILVVYPILVVIKKLYKNYFFGNSYSYPLSLLITLLFYGLGENVVFNQVLVLCFIVWSIVFSQLDYQKKEEVKI